MKHVHSRRLLSGVSTIALIAGVAFIAAAEEVIPPPLLDFAGITDRIRFNADVAAPVVLEIESTGVVLEDNGEAIFNSDPNVTIEGDIIINGLVQSQNDDAIHFRDDGFATFNGTLFVGESGQVLGDEDGLDIDSDIFASAALDGNVIVNSGLIRGTNQSGIDIDNNAVVGNIVNETTGNISGGESGFRLADGATFTGNIVNRGVVEGTDDGGAGIVVENGALFTGRIVNETTGVIRGVEDGIRFEDANVMGASPVVDNAGSILGNGDEGIQISGTTTFSGDIVNRATGTIAGVDDGIEIEGANVDFTGNIDNSGLIQGGADEQGIEIDNAEFSGQIINREGGTIRGGDDGIRIESEGSLSFAGEAIQNYGLILGTDANADGIHLGGEGVINGDIHNYAAGTIQGQGTGVGIEIDGDLNGDIVNDGSILAALVSGTAIEIDGSVGTIFNTGVIQAHRAVDLRDADDATTITQTGGSIFGELRLRQNENEHADTYNANGGTYEGDIFGSYEDNVFVAAYTGVGYGHSNTWAYKSGTVEGLDQFDIVGGTAVLGGRFRGDRWGAGVTLNDVNAMEVGGGPERARLYLDDQTQINLNNTYTQYNNGSLEYRLTGVDTNAGGEAGVDYGQINTDVANLDGRIGANLDVFSFAGLGNTTEFFYDNVIDANTRNGVFDFYDPGTDTSALFTNSIFFNGVAEYDGGDNVDLRIFRTPFDEVLAPGAPANKIAVGEMLEEIYAYGGDLGGLGELYKALFKLGDDYAFDGLTDEQKVLLAYNSIDGNVHAQVAWATLLVAEALDQNVRERLREIHYEFPGQYWAGAANKVYAQNGAVISDARPLPQRTWNFWARAFGSSGELDGNGGSEGIEHDTSGVTVGFDWRARPHSAWGLAFSFADTDVDAEALWFVPGATSEIESWQIALYGAHSWGSVYTDILGSVTFNEHDTQRFDAWLWSHHAEFDSTVYSIYGELGTFFGDERGGLRWNPFGALGYRSADIDDFSETCTWMAPCLTVADNEIDSFYSILGLRLSDQWNWGWGPRAIVPELHAAWRHEFEDDHHFIGWYTPTTPFVVAGSDLPQDFLDVGAKLTVPVADGLALSASYQGLLADEADQHRVAFAFLANW